METVMTWRKSTKSGPAGNCVEVAFSVNHVMVRDSKRPTESALSFTFREWELFLARVREGEFDRILAPDTPSLF